MSLPGSASPASADRRRDYYAHRSGEAVVATQTGLDDIDPAIGARQPAVDGDGARDAST